MDLKRFGKAMDKLRGANECRAAAQMDVEDAEHCLCIAKRKLEAMEQVATEARQAVDILIEHGAMAPLLLTKEAEDGEA